MDICSAKGKRGKIVSYIIIFLFLSIILFMGLTLCGWLYDRYKFQHMETVRFIVYDYHLEESIIYEYYPEVKKKEIIGKLPGRFFGGRTSEDNKYIMGFRTYYDEKTVEIIKYYLDSGNVEVCLGKEEGAVVLKDWMDIYQADLFFYGEIYESYIYADMNRVCLGKEILYDMETGKVQYLRKILDDDTRAVHICAINEDIVFYANEDRELYRLDINNGKTEFVAKKPKGKCHIYNDGEKIASVVGNSDKYLSIYDKRRYTWKQAVKAGWNTKIAGFHPSEEMYWHGNGEYLFYETRLLGPFGGWSSSVKMYSLNSGISYTIYSDTENVSNKISFVVSTRDVT